MWIYKNNAVCLDKMPFIDGDDADTFVKELQSRFGFLSVHFFVKDIPNDTPYRYYIYAYGDDRHVFFVERHLDVQNKLTLVEDWYFWRNPVEVSYYRLDEIPNSFFKLGIEYLIRHCDSYNKDYLLRFPLTDNVLRELWQLTFYNDWGIAIHPIGEYFLYISRSTDFFANDYVVSEVELDHLLYLGKIDKELR